MDVIDIIAKRLAAPKQFRVVTLYASGVVKMHDAETIGQAENWATGERRKIGRDLISYGDDLGHKAGDIVRVVSVEIEEI